jgi:vacuolar-type H+-ATPase catalytic subunit A/Vma1
MILCVLFHIAFNLLLMGLDKVSVVKNHWKRYRMMRKYAKVRGEKNRLLQKKLRHERWKKQTEQILGRPMRTKKEKLQQIAEEEEKKEQSYEMA